MTWFLHLRQRCCVPLRASCLSGAPLFAMAESHTRCSPTVQSARYHDASLMDESVSELLGTYGDALIRLMEPSWQSQVVALEGFMEGLKDRFCPQQSHCRRRSGPGGCQGAHSLAEMIPAVLAAARAVEATAGPFLRADERDERVPFLRHDEKER